MRNDLDIEDVLKKHRHAPDSRIKRSVLARFARRYRDPETSWLHDILQRRVPFYLAAAQIIVALGLGFTAARILPFAKHDSKTAQTGPARIDAVSPTEETVAAEVPAWQVAPNDIL